MFEILEHPADIGFRAFGGTLEELFANAAVALVSIACEIEEVAPRTEYALSATGTDYESLLVNWVREGGGFFGRRVYTGRRRGGCASGRRRSRGAWCWLCPCRAPCVFLLCGGPPPAPLTSSPTPQKNPPLR